MIYYDIICTRVCMSLQYYNSCNWLPRQPFINILLCVRMAAIIYMHYIEIEILKRFDGKVIWKRYIDDVFYISTCDNITNERLLHIVNNINTNIKFTLEIPVNNTIPFLDMDVTYNINSNSFTYT